MLRIPHTLSQESLWMTALRSTTKRYRKSRRGSLGDFGKEMKEGKSMAHVLLEHAYKYGVPICGSTPDGCSFNQNKGYWVSNSTGQALMESDDPKPTTTKKWDIETGEDQKGE